MTAGSKKLLVAKSPPTRCFLQDALASSGIKSKFRWENREHILYWGDLPGNIDSSPRVLRHRSGKLGIFFKRGRIYTGFAVKSLR